MGTFCASLFANIFVFCFANDFMLSLSDNNQAVFINGLDSTSIYLDDLLDGDNSYLVKKASHIYSTTMKPISYF